jgi:cytochrome c peroxidase
VVPRLSLGALNKFDDLPSVLRANVDVIDQPLTRKEGEVPAWSDAEIDDVIAFLQTLTDRDAQSAITGWLYLDMLFNKMYYLYNR